MKSILVIGMGRFGRHCIRTLVNLGHDVMALDVSEEKLGAIVDIATNCQIGDSTDEQFMKTIGISDFDVTIVAIGDDFQASLETTYLVKKLGCPLVVARASREVHAQFLERNGADKVIYPEKQMAVWTAVTYSSEHIFDYVQLDSKHSIYEYDVPKKWIGKSVIELNVRQKYGVNVLAIKQNGELQINFKPDMPLEKDMTILVLGSEQTQQKFFNSQYD